MSTKRVTRSATRTALASEDQPRLTEFYNVRTKPSRAQSSSKTISTAIPEPKNEVETKEKSPEPPVSPAQSKEVAKSLDESLEVAGSLPRILENSFSGDKKKYSNLERLPLKVRENSKIDLPKKFSKLYDVFKHMERIVQISLSIGKRIVLEDIRSGVEKHLKKTFSIDNFAQLLYIYPEAYTVRLELRRLQRASANPWEKYEYVIDPNLKSDVVEFIQPEETKNGVKSGAGLNVAPRLEGWRIQCRCYILKHKMVEYLITHKETAKIPLATLPEPPKPKITVEKFKKEVPVNGALEEVEQKMAKMSLLERLKAKEAKKKALQDEQSANHHLKTKKAKLQDMIKQNVLYNLEKIYRVKNRTILPAKEVITALARGCNISTAEMKERVNLLVEVAKDVLEYGSIPGCDGSMLRWKAARNLEELVLIVKGEIEEISAELSA